MVSAQLVPLLPLLSLLWLVITIVSAQPKKLFIENGPLGRPLVGSTNGERYIWHNGFESAWITSRKAPTAELDDQAWQGSFIALFYWIDAKEYTGRRILLSAQQTFKKFPPSGAGSDAWAGVFVRVDALDGTVLAFDNMAGRRVQTRGSHQVQAVVDVPALPVVDDPDTCPSPQLVPERIAVGTFLVGRGHLVTNQAWLRLAAQGRDVTLSGWTNPCLNDLGEGYAVPSTPYWPYIAEVPSSKESK